MATWNIAYLSDTRSSWWYRYINKNILYFIIILYTSKCFQNILDILALSIENINQYTNNILLLELERLKVETFSSRIVLPQNFKQTYLIIGFCLDSFGMIANSQPNQPNVKWLFGLNESTQTKACENSKVSTKL